MAQKFTLKFLRKEQVAKDTWSFFFKKNKKISNFLPGQYMHIFLPKVIGDEQGNSRMFTIASSPIEEEIMITTRLGKSNFKQALAKLPMQSQVSCYGYSGGFILPDKDSSPRLFISGGIGITPFRSMIIYASQTYIKTPLTLLACFSSLEKTIFHKELSDIADKTENIKIHFCVSDNDQMSKQVHMAHERISQELILKHLAAYTNPTVMISGSPQFVEKILMEVSTIGIPEGNIKVDEFVGY